MVPYKINHAPSRPGDKQRPAPNEATTATL